jgi:hypothetical protein
MERHDPDPPLSNVSSGAGQSQTIRLGVLRLVAAFFFHQAFQKVGAFRRMEIQSGDESPHWYGAFQKSFF